MKETIDILGIAKDGTRWQLVDTSTNEILWEEGEERIIASTISKKKDKTVMCEHCPICIDFDEDVCLGEKFHRICKISCEEYNILTARGPFRLLTERIGQLEKDRFTMWKGYTAQKEKEITHLKSEIENLTNEIIELKKPWYKRIVNKIVKSN